MMSVLNREILKERNANYIKSVSIHEFRTGVPTCVPLWIFYKQMRHLFKTARKYKLDIVAYDISGVEYSLPLLFLLEEFRRCNGRVTYVRHNEPALDAVDSLIFIDKLQILPRDITYIIRNYLYNSIAIEKNLSSLCSPMTTYDLHYLSSRT